MPVSFLAPDVVKPAQHEVLNLPSGPDAPPSRFLPVCDGKFRKRSFLRNSVTRAFWKTSHALRRQNWALFVVGVHLRAGPDLIQRSVAQAQAQAQADAEKARAEQLKELAAKLERMFDALEEAAKEISRDTFDPQVIIQGQKEAGIERVGEDPVRLFEWVRDNTYLVPYRGALRGHKGVLMDRLGNSLDRALLLGELLRLSRKKVRLVRAELSEEEAHILLEKARRIPEGGALPREAADRGSLEEDLAEYAKKYDLNVGELRQVIDQNALKSQRLAEQAVQRTCEQSQMLLDMLKEKTEIPSRDEQIEQIGNDAVQAFLDHWWIQWQDGSKWVDLDPSLPNAKAGDPFTSKKSKVELTTEKVKKRAAEQQQVVKQQEKADKNNRVIEVVAAVAIRVKAGRTLEKALSWDEGCWAEGQNGFHEPPPSSESTCAGSVPRSGISKT